MTTNQTIDGVSRRMLTALLCHVSELENRALVDELRALLDKEVTGDSRAPQPQGEPVAWKTGSITWAYEPDARRHGNQYEVTVVPLYAEQTAPVAVALPERREVAGEGGHAYYIPVGWNACLDEVTRLNAKPR